MSVFSNGTDYEIFYSRWCDHCKSDSEARDTGYGGCPILLAAMCDEPTPQLIEDGRQVTCTAFIDIDTPKPLAPIEVSPNQLMIGDEA